MEELDFVLPDRPVPLEELVSIGEPALDTLGLASWWPAGRLQYFMEHLHLGWGALPGMEWWQAILLTTVIIRGVVFPIVVYAQRNMANMNNSAPHLAHLQEKFTVARKRNDFVEMSSIGKKIQDASGGANPLKSFLPMCGQLPFFMSMFLGLRGMSNLPVESMKEGGMLWFPDLTMADPYYALPILTSLTLFMQLKLGIEYGVKAGGPNNSPIMKVAIMAMPCMLFFFTFKFPAALCFYWFITNIVSVGQGMVLRVPAVRQHPWINIPQMKVHEQPKAKPGAKAKGPMEQFRETMDNSSIMARMQGRDQATNFGRDFDEKQFKDAATRKIRTFKYDPTKPNDIKFKDGKRVK